MDKILLAVMKVLYVVVCALSNSVRVTNELYWSIAQYRLNRASSIKHDSKHYTSILMLVLCASVFTLTGCGDSNDNAQSVIDAVKNNPIATTTGALVEKYNHPTGIEFPVPCAKGAPGCSDEIIQSLKDIGANHSSKDYPISVVLFTYLIGFARYAYARYNSKLGVFTLAWKNRYNTMNLVGFSDIVALDEYARNVLHADCIEWAGTIRGH